MSINMSAYTEYVKKRNTYDNFFDFYLKQKA